MKKLSIFIFLLISAELPAQQQKGFSVTHEDSSQSHGATYALIVGISDYKYIPPLQYATEDAFLFYQFLKSKSGGSIPESNIRLLTDEEATSGNIWIRGISWLQNVVKPGDKIIFYFSGHGDAVNAQEAYFLACDAVGGDKNNYAVSGTIDISKLKNRIHDFTARRVEVELFIDACRTDDIPGGRQGLKDYNSVIESKAGELLYLSCSPNEVSVEDKRWGNGHGVFTWYLVNGLSGKADEDGDNNISFYELKNYVEQNVVRDTRALGNVQTPYHCCNQYNERFLSVKDKDFQESIKQTEIEGTDKFSEQLLAARSANANIGFPDSTLRLQFFALRKLCREKNFLDDNSADSIYNLLAQKYSDKELKPVKDYYVSALLDESQVAVNRILTVAEGIFQDKTYYQEHRKILERAIQLIDAANKELLNELRVRLDYLKANEIFEKFEGTSCDEKGSFAYMWDNGRMVKDYSLQALQNEMQLLKNSIASGFEFAPAYYLLARSYRVIWFATVCKNRILGISDSLEERKALGVEDSTAKYSLLAIKKAPGWVLPYAYLNSVPFYSAEKIVSQLLNQEKTNALYYATAANFYNSTGRWFNRGISDLDLNSASEKLFLTECAEKADSLYRISFSIDPNQLDILMIMGEHFSESENGCDSIISHFLKFFEAHKIHPPSNTFVQSEGNWSVGDLFPLIANCKPGQNILKNFEFICRQQLALKDSAGTLPAFYVLEKDFLKNLLAADSVLRLGMNYRRWNDECLCRRADPVYFMEDVSDIYHALGELNEEEAILKRCAEMFPGDKWASFSLARFYSRNKKDKSALLNLQLALDKGFDDFESIETNDFDPIRLNPKFQVLMKNYFPDQYKE